MPVEKTTSPAATSRAANVASPIAPFGRTATSAERFRATLADLPIPPSPTPPNGPGDLTAEQRLALEIFADPIAWHRHGETVYPLLMQGYAADSPEVEAALYARRH